MDKFIDFTLIKSGRKMAVNKNNIDSFSESSIYIEGIDVDCLVISNKDGTYIKVSETFYSTLKRIQEGEK